MSSEIGIGERHKMSACACVRVWLYWKMRLWVLVWEKLRRGRECVWGCLLEWNWERERGGERVSQTERDREWETNIKFISDGPNRVSSLLSIFATNSSLVDTERRRKDMHRPTDVSTTTHANVAVGGSSLSAAAAAAAALVKYCQCFRVEWTASNTWS